MGGDSQTRLPPTLPWGMSPAPPKRCTLVCFLGTGSGGWGQCQKQRCLSPPLRQRWWPPAPLRSHSASGRAEVTAQVPAHCPVSSVALWAAECLLGWREAWGLTGHVGKDCPQESWAHGKSWELESEAALQGGTCFAANRLGGPGQPGPSWGSPRQRVGWEALTAGSFSTCDFSNATSLV